jgi:hypothetical protein
MAPKNKGNIPEFSPCNFLYPPVILSLLNSNILLRTLFSNTHGARDKDSHPYKTVGKIIVLCILQTGS